MRVPLLAQRKKFPTLFLAKQNVKKFSSRKSRKGKCTHTHTQMQTKLKKKLYNVAI
jgi:hypothetical protein